MNPEDDFLLVLTESGLKQQLIRAIEDYLQWKPVDGMVRGSAKQEVVDAIVTDLILHGKYGGQIG